MIKKLFNVKCLFISLIKLELAQAVQKQESEQVRSWIPPLQQTLNLCNQALQECQQVQQVADDWYWVFLIPTHFLGQHIQHNIWYRGLKWKALICNSGKRNFLH